MTEEKKVRLGLVRCDTHGYYYGIMMQECDPLLLQKHNYVVHHYAGNIYDPKMLTMPRVPGFEIVKAYDDDFKSAKMFSEVFQGKPVACETLEEMTDGIDAVFIADCDLGGGDHLKLATPFLKKGIPTFVDKPFASTLKDAKEIVRLARENHAPLFNASILSYVPAAVQFKNRFDEIAKAYWPLPSSRPDLPIGIGVVKGVGGAFSQELGGQAVSGGIEERLAYIIHGVSLGIHLFGKGVDWVEAMGALPLEYLHLHLKSGIEVMVLNTSVDIFPENCSFYASAYSKYGAVNSSPIGDPEFLGGAEIILQLFRDMVNTGKPPVPYEDFIEHIAVVEAGQLSQQTGRKVTIQEIMEATP